MAETSCFGCNTAAVAPPDERPLMGGYASTSGPMSTQQLRYVGSGKSNEYVPPIRGTSGPERWGASPPRICFVIGAVVAAVGVAIIFYMAFTTPTTPTKLVSHAAPQANFVPSDCVGSNWLKWTQARREYCYTVVKQKDQPQTPLPPPPPTKDPFDCEAELSDWRTAWSNGQKAWCCKEKGKGCTDEVCVTKGCDAVCEYDVSGEQGHVSCRDRVKWARHNSKHVSKGNMLGAISLVKDECRCQCACSLDDFTAEEHQDGRQN